ncbi:hypothetical protein [Halovivax gelatinilyticus]|uniref:hypothetical protein n=1 Tax=Halovivax gelatinilyticus TaxID=2961597 RepID=UPI0020CA3CF5|nr:hypothetical protein [Halovivax gelatinilyticus]
MTREGRIPATGYATERDRSVEYDDRTIWLSRTIESAATGLPGGPLVAGFLLFGWLPIALAGLGIVAAESMSATFVLAYATAALLLSALPSMIWYYDVRVLTTFAGRMTARVDDEDVLVETAERFDRRFAEWYPAAVVPWTILLLVVLFGSVPTLEAQGIGGPTEPLFWSVALFFVWGGLLTGIGFHGAFVTVGYIATLVERTRLSIDPYHPDKLGGLSAVGYFAIRTTLLLSSGALLLPLAFELAAGTPFQEPIYLAVVVYVLVIVGSFCYPTWLVNRAAHAERVERLDELGDEIGSIQTDLSAASAHDVDDVVTQLELQRLQQLYDDYREIRLYPLSPSILTQLVGSVLLPSTILFVELVAGV